MTLERSSANSATAHTPLHDALAFNGSFGCPDEVKARLDAYLRKRLDIDDDDMELFMSDGRTTSHIHIEVFVDGHLVLVDEIDFDNDFNMEDNEDMIGGLMPIDCYHGCQDGEDFCWAEDEGHSQEYMVARVRGYVPPDEHIAQRAGVGHHISP